MTAVSPAMLYFAKQRFAFHPSGARLEEQTDPNGYFINHNGVLESFWGGGAYLRAYKTFNAYLPDPPGSSDEEYGPVFGVNGEPQRLVGSISYARQLDPQGRVYVADTYVVPALRDTDLALQLFDKVITDYPNTVVDAVVINDKLKLLVDRYNQKVRQNQERQRQLEVEQNLQQPAQFPVAQPRRVRPQPVPEGQLNLFSKLARPGKPGSDQLQFSMPGQEPQIGSGWADRNPDQNFTEFFQGRYDDGFKFILHPNLPDGFKMWPVREGVPHHGEIMDHYGLDTRDMFRRQNIVPGVVAAGYMNTLGGEEPFRTVAKQKAQAWLAANAPDWVNAEGAEHEGEVDPWGEFGSAQPPESAYEESEYPASAEEYRTDQCPACGAYRSPDAMQCYNCSYPFPPRAQTISSVHQAGWDNRVPWLIMNDGEVRIGNPGTLHADIGAGMDYENAAVRGIINLDKRPDYSDAVQVYWNKSVPHELAGGQWMPTSTGIRKCRSFQTKRQSSRSSISTPSSLQA